MQSDSFERRKTARVIPPSAPAARHALADGVHAVLPGLAWLPATRTLIVADAHLGYEDVVGGALPLWSTTAIVATLELAATDLRASEVIFLGDVVHGVRMSEGAAARVRGALDDLRAVVEVRLIAGNHEGRTRGHAVIGPTTESLDRAGWHLAHGDVPAAQTGRRTIIGHLHPSLPLGGGATAPAFLASERLVVVPALTPYSSGLDVLSEACGAALAAWDHARCDLHVVAATAERLFPFGTLSALRAVVRRPAAPRGRVRPRRRLAPDR